MTTPTMDQVPDAPAEETAYRPELEDVGRVPFTRLLRVELRKMTNTRAGRGVLVAILAVTVLAMGITLWVARDTGIGLLPLLIAAITPQALLLPVLGVMTAANEWSQRTALITFSQEPRRLRVMAAKTVAAVLLGLAVLAVTLLLGLLGHVLSMALVDGGSVDIALGGSFLFNLVVVQVQGVLLGIAFGALLLNVPLGIVAYFLVPVVSNLVFMMTAWLRDNAAWLDLGTAGQPLLGEGWLTGQQWAQVGTTTALWVLLPLVLGLVRIVRKEVK